MNPAENAVNKTYRVHGYVEELEEGLGKVLKGKFRLAGTYIANGQNVATVVYDSQTGNLVMTPIEGKGVYLEMIARGLNRKCGNGFVQLEERANQ